MERRVCVSRLNSVDLPTFGRPQIATSGRCRNASCSLSVGSETLRRQRLGLAPRALLMRILAAAPMLFWLSF